MRDEDEERLVKVAFDLPDEVAAYACASTELLWAAKAPGAYRVEIRTIPLYADGVSFGDVVRVHIDRDRREVVCDGLAERGGHATVQLVLMDPGVRDELTALLDGHGADHETHGVLWAVDIPPEADYPSVLADLVTLAADGARLEIRESAPPPAVER